LSVTSTGASSVTCLADSVADLAISLNDILKPKETLRANDDLSKAGVKFDANKARYDLIPPEGPLAVATILDYGAKKYAARNWEQGMDWSRPYSAIHRHLAAWWGGENNDPDTGKSHLWHVATNVFFLIAFEARGRGTDDRPTTLRP
jgi:hypothetical protein